MDHFVKYLSYVDDDGQVQKYSLDLDGSLSDTKACALAVRASLEKLNLNGRKIALDGQTTDSGGGGALDRLAEEPCTLELTVDLGECSVGACGIHCLQLQLSNGTRELIGEGGVSNRNGAQLLHTIYDLQGCMPPPQMKHLMDAAQEFHDEWCDKDCAPNQDDAGDVQFAEKWNKVLKFRRFDKIEKYLILMG